MKNEVIRTILSSLLIVVMLFTAVPITASAATSGKCGDNLTWTFNQSTGLLSITGTGVMPNYDYYNRPWEDYEDNIKSVTIGNSVTKIGNYAFTYCYSLTSVTIGNSVTTIGDDAFSYCDSLTSVTIPDSVTTIGECAFCDCDSLTNITIGNSVTTIGNYAFYDCDSPTSVTIPDSVTTIGGWAFCSCDSLTSVTIGNSVTTIGYYAFSWCTNLTSVTVDADNQYYSSDSYGVLYNKNKTELIQYPIGNSRTSFKIPDSVTTIGECAFCDCDSLTGVIIPDSVTTIGVGAFEYCDSLTSVDIGNSVTTIVNDAFRNCDSLTSVTIPDSVTTIGYYAFCDCDSLTSVTVDADNQYYSSDSYGVLYNKNKTELIQYPIGNSRTSFKIPDSVTRIGNDAFYNCDSLTSVTIGNSVTTIGNYAFYSCDSLTNVYYSGTQEQWNNISIGSWNEDLTSANIHFNSTIDEKFYYSQSHAVEDYIANNTEYESKYFGGNGIALDGADGTPDMCFPGISLGENMVPQGVAYYEAENQILISAYYKDAEQQSYPCYVFALDMETGDLVNEYKIIDSDSSTFMGHVGGIAVSDYNLYITGEDADICKVSLSQLEKKTGEIIIEDKVSISEWLGNANASYLSIDNGMLITGNFFCATDSKYDTPAKAANSVILAQNLSGNSAESEWNNFCSSAPFAIVKVPDSIEKIQGVCYRDEKFYISSSFGRRNTSTFYIADIDKTSGYTLKNIMSYAAPPMMEGITFVGNYIYTVFESASAFYFNGLDGGKKSLEPTDVVWKIDYKKFNSIYNLGEETYSFDNFGDSDSPDGHCFGMSVTSAGYYLNELDITDIGLNSSSELYTASETAKIKKPICKYQKKQGSYSRKAIVAGGTRYKYGYADIASDWEEVVRYVKSHKYDNTGELQIGFQKVSQGGHAINFLRYENVNGEDRIYAYDNNFPNTETYFCKGSDGKVYQKPYSTFSGAIDCIALRSVEKYFDLVEGFDLSRVIYGWADTIYVEGVTGYPMDLGGSGEYMMYEIPDGVDEVVIVPLTDNATFEYMNEDYQFGGINEETYGVFTLSTSESSNDESFVIENEQSSVDEVFVYDLDMTYKSYAWIETEIYVTGNADYTVEYSSSNPSVAYVDEFGEVYAAGEGSAEITCTVTDEYGNVVTDTCEVKVSYAWWQWIIRILLLGFLWY